MPRHCMHACMRGMAGAALCTALLCLKRVPLPPRARHHTGAQPDEHVVVQQHHAHRQERGDQPTRPQHHRHEEVQRVPCGVCVPRLHDRCALRCAVLCVRTTCVLCCAVELARCRTPLGHSCISPAFMMLPVSARFYPGLGPGVGQQQMALHASLHFPMDGWMDGHCPPVCLRQRGHLPSMHPFPPCMPASMHACMAAAVRRRRQHRHQPVDALQGGRTRVLRQRIPRRHAQERPPGAQRHHPHHQV